MKTIDELRNTILQGHVLDKLKEIPDHSIDMVITSPPYFNLRDYKTSLVWWDETGDCLIDEYEDTPLYNNREYICKYCDKDFKNV